MVTAKSHGGDGLDTYGLAIPASELRNFIAQHLANYLPPPERDARPQKPARMGRSGCERQGFGLDGAEAESELRGAALRFAVERTSPGACTGRDRSGFVNPVGETIPFRGDAAKCGPGRDGNHAARPSGL